MTTHPGKYNLYIYRGATFRKIITWKDENGVVIDLTGFTARLHMRETVGSSTPFLPLTTENGGIILGGASGTITIQATADATSAISASSGVYDLEIVAGDTITVTRLLEGFVTISPEVTR